MVSNLLYTYNIIRCAFILIVILVVIIKYKENVQSLIGAAIKFKDNILDDIEKHPEYIDYNAIKNAS